MSGISAKGKKKPKPLRSKQMHHEDEDLTITLNTNDTLQFVQWQTARRIPYALRCYYNISRLLKQVSTFRMYPEISPKGRIHYHGIINLYDSFEFYSHIIPLLNEVCMFEIDTIDDMDYWESYIQKDRNIMEPGLTSHKIPYELTSQINIKKWDTPIINIRKNISKNIYEEEEDFRTSILDFIEEHQ